MAARKNTVLIDERQRLQIETRKRVGDWIWYGAISVLLLLVVIGALSSAAAVNPRFCAACHAQTTAKLAASPHASLDCDACHRSQGTLGLMENRLWVAGMVVQAPIEALTPGSAGAARVDSKRCKECHVRQLGATFERNGVRMNHAAPVRENWSCQRCHRDVGHPEQAKSVAVYSMGTCLQCHNSGTATLSACKICHVDDLSPSAKRFTGTSWKVTHGPNWQKTHGMGDLPTCKACHAPDYCVGCHKMEIPHPAGFMTSHGEVVLTKGSQDCEGCHAKSACEGCHGMPMPHPSGFAVNHKLTVEKDGKKPCERCHAKSSCDGCHERHIHPGVDPELLKKLQQKPVVNR